MYTPPTNPAGPHWDSDEPGFAGLPGAGADKGSSGPGAAGGHSGGGGGGGGRLNMLLSCGSWRRGESWADHLPRLLAPMGVQTCRVHSGREATRLLESGQPFHIAVVDLALPIDPGAPDTRADEHPAAAFTRHASQCIPEEGGARLLQLLARLGSPPPTVVVKRAMTQKDDARQLAEALRLGVFAVVDRPVDLELMLEIFRRVLHRHYKDRWPGTTTC